LPSNVIFPHIDLICYIFFKRFHFITPERNENRGYCPENVCLKVIECGGVKTAITPFCVADVVVVVVTKNGTRNMLFTDFSPSIW